MKYKVVFTGKAKKSLKKLDKNTVLFLVSWIRKNLENCENPRKFGKALAGNKSGQWRYRIGNYRIISEIQDDNIIILVLNIGHRKDIYKK